MAARYEVEFCRPDGRKAVGIDVAVAATTVTVTAQGTISLADLPIINGNEFVIFGIPPRPIPDPDIFRFGLWDLSAEQAVQAVYTFVRTPIRTVPEATGCTWFLDPCAGHNARLWRMETAEPVPIRRQGATQDEMIHVFFVTVGLGGGGVYVAASDQPEPAYLVYDLTSEPGTVVDSVLLNRSGPLAMQPFTVVSAPSQ